MSITHLQHNKRILYKIKGKALVHTHNINAAANECGMTMTKKNAQQCTNVQQHI